MWDGFPVFALGFCFVRNYDLLVSPVLLLETVRFLDAVCYEQVWVLKIRIQIEAFSNAGGTEFVISSSERIYIRTSHTFCLS